jgi:hypothetical protein
MRLHRINLDDQYSMPKIINNYKGGDASADSSGAVTSGGVSAITRVDIGMYHIDPLAMAQEVKTDEGNQQREDSKSSSASTSSSNSTAAAAAASKSFVTANNAAAQRLQAPQQQGGESSLTAPAPTKNSSSTSETLSAETMKWNVQWGKFLSRVKPENVLMSSEIGKKNALGRTAVRELILTDAPRLFYVEVSSMTQKGEDVEWLPTRPPVASLVDASTFNVATADRVYKFFDRSNVAGTAAKWVNILNVTAAQKK